MSSSEDDGQIASTPPLQSAQRQANELYAENEDPSLASGYLSDALSDRATSLKGSPYQDSSAGIDSRAEQSNAEDEHQDFLDENSQDSTSLPPRSNKFRGPPSTWRNWTAPERDLSASLDQLQAKDLSVHLYNSFKLKQRNSKWGPGRQPQSSNDAEAHKGSKWIPPKVWTAWPLPPGIVPREQDESRWEEDTVLPVLYRTRQRRPGQHLQETLVAQVLRKAKERFHHRSWEGAPHSSTNSTPQRERSQGRERDSNGKFCDKEDHDVSDQKPVVMSDDQRASEILQATVQHMMTKLDDLLLGLHHARSAYLQAEDSDTDSLSQKSQRSTSRGRPQKRKRKSSNPHGDAEASHVNQAHPSSDTDEDRPSKKSSSSKDKVQNARSVSCRSRSRNFRSRKARLGLRDWSDVLGVASMTAWHQGVVGNAAARCAALFGEGIKFRTLEEGKAPEEHLYLPDASPSIPREHSQNNTWRASEGPSNGSGSLVAGGVHLDDFLKPIEKKKSWVYKKSKQSKRRQPSNKPRE
ncbi:hypothetical protein IMSHALPRED_010464 [Imshaugia aleurites]|uniref:Rrn9 domain-containing protein n=1 Tax=Imshaugia aleurites TaxID=172621 RepID=A0A8H3GAI1_9LECA|nr:hypothetical protein IMSHALPRED_010464 [Imshaugia aleurites]